jgi:hypothetical protein
MSLAAPIDVGEASTSARIEEVPVVPKSTPEITTSIAALPRSIFISR